MNVCVCVCCSISGIVPPPLQSTGCMCIIVPHHMYGTYICVFLFLRMTCEKDGNNGDVIL